MIGADVAGVEPLNKNPIPPSDGTALNAFGFNNIVPISGRNQP